MRWIPTRTVWEWSSPASVDRGGLGGLQFFEMMMVGDRLELRRGEKPERE